jgi:hypothetical protein
VAAGTGSTVNGVGRPVLVADFDGKGLTVTGVVAFDCAKAARPNVINDIKMIVTFFMILCLKLFPPTRSLFGYRVLSLLWILGLLLFIVTSFVLLQTTCQTLLF